MCAVTNFYIIYNYGGTPILTLYSILKNGNCYQISQKNIFNDLSNEDKDIFAHYILEEAG